MTSPYILRGFGFHTPERILTNKDLEKIVDTSDEWITSRTGIQQRHVLSEGEINSDLAVGAARKALAHAGLTADDITHIVVATCTPDASCPNTASIVANKLGRTNVMAMDCNAACSGFLYILTVARGLVAVEKDACVLLIASETITYHCDWTDRSTCVLFGDGAGAVVMTNKEGALENTDNFGIPTGSTQGYMADAPANGLSAVLEDVMVSADGSLGELLTIGTIKACPSLGDPITEDYFIHMRGPEVFKHAVRSMTSISKAIIERNGLTTEDIDLIIPHQANLRIIDAVSSRLGVTEDKVFINVQYYGNTSAASVPLAIADAIAQGRIKKGDRVLLTTFGGGFTWGAALLRF